MSDIEHHHIPADFRYDYERRGLVRICACGAEQIDSTDERGFITLHGWVGGLTSLSTLEPTP